MARIWLLAPALLTVGCIENGLSSGPEPGNGTVPDILVDPPSLMFGELRSGDEELLSFEVLNVGDATLNVADVVLATGLAFTVVGPELEFYLEPGDSTFVDVAFSPLGADENYGQIQVQSDDPDSPSTPVDLLGIGSVPELAITPGSYGFGETFVPCGAEVDLTLENVGREDLVISDFGYTSGGDLLLHADALRAELPLTLPPGGTRTVSVEFVAATAGSDTGTLAVQSNDPRGEVTADQNGEGAWAESRSETFHEPTVAPVDVLMLIDQSGSMSDANADDVTAGIPDFIAELQLLADWQLIQVTEEDGCANGGILDSSVGNTSQLLINNAFASDDHDLTESLLELASVALSKTGPGGCNAGFLRPGALLHIIAISDEPEQSGMPYTHWLSDYESYTGDPALLTLSAVVDLDGCEDGGEGYIEATTATGGTSLDICNATWGTQMSNLASEVLPGGRSYELSADPEPTSVRVTVDGTPATDVDVIGRHVTVNAPLVGEGDVVEVTYGVLAICE